MIHDIYDPLTEYENTFRSRFREIAEQTFDELAKDADLSAVELSILDATIVEE